MKAVTVLLALAFACGGALAAEEKKEPSAAQKAATSLTVGDMPQHHEHIGSPT